MGSLAGCVLADTMPTSIMKVRGFQKSTKTSNRY